MEYVGMYCKKRQEKHKRAIKQSTSFCTILRKYLSFSLKFILDEKTANLVYMNKVEFVGWVTFLGNFLVFQI